MSDLPIPFAAAIGDLENELAAVSRTMAAVIADPQSRPADRRPPTIDRRMAEVTAVNLGPPLTADVLLNGATIPGASPQCTYRPQVGDYVWLEFQGADPHISPPLTTTANRRWNPLTLSGGWSGPVDYWRDAQGTVWTRGSMSGGASGNFATLPAGFRPTYDVPFVVAVLTSTPSWTFGIVIVRTTGVMEYSGGAGTVYLSGITFRID